MNKLSEEHLKLRSDIFLTGLDEGVDELINFYAYIVSF